MRAAAWVLAAWVTVAGCGSGPGAAGNGGATGTAGSGTSGTSGSGTSGTTGGAGTGANAGNPGSAGAAGVAGAAAGTGGTTSGDAGVPDGAIDVPTDAPTCNAIEYTGTRLLPDILLVLDASGSMNDDILNNICTGGCGATSKWALMTAVITQVLSQTDTTVNWGLKLFASDSTCGVSAMANVPVGPSTGTSIAAAIAGRTDANGNVTNGSRTPTAAAITAGSTYLSTLTSPNPRFMLLATDGLANCAAVGGQTADDTVGAVMSVAAAFQSGIPTFVVGIATEGLVTNAVSVSDSLAMLANAGGRPRSGTPSYYPVSSANELATTLTTLVRVATGCVFQLGSPPASAGPPTVTATSGNTPVTIPRDPGHSNGYDYTDASMTAIRIYGPTCDKITSGEIATVKITFACTSG